MNAEGRGLVEEEVSIEGMVSPGGPTPGPPLVGGPPQAAEGVSGAIESSGSV